MTPYKQASANLISASQAYEARLFARLEALENHPVMVRALAQLDKEEKTMTRPRVTHTATTLPNGNIRTESITTQPDGTSKSGVSVSEHSISNWQMIFVQCAPPAWLSQVSYRVTLDGVVVAELL